MIEKLKRLYRFIFKSIPKYKIEYNASIERHGSTYGGWNILKDSLNKNSKVISVGIGEDISFDISVINKYGCNILAYDPTPKVVEFISCQPLPKEFIFFPIALSASDGSLTFYPPENKENISHTAYKKENGDPVIVNAQKLSTIMRNNNLDEIDLLKIDIEGFEFDVIDNIIEENLKIKQLLIEFHHFFPEVGNEKTEMALRKLASVNYKLYNVSDSFCEFAFIKTTI